MRSSLLLVALVAIALPALAAPEKASSTMPTKRASDPEVGQRLYKQSCWQCHGEKGQGDGPAAKALLAPVPPLVAKDEGKFEKLIDVIQDGRGRMPAYSEDIDRHDSRRILVYLKELGEGRAPGAAKPEDGDEPEKPEAGGAEGQ